MQIWATSGDPAALRLQVESHFGVNAKGFTNVQVSDRSGRPDRRDCRGLRQASATRGAARPDRHRRAACRGEIVSLTGQVRAKDQASLAFRLDGRMIERPVNVGDVVTAGQIVARLDPQNQQNALRSAQANLASARGGADRRRASPSGGSRSC